MTDPPAAEQELEPQLEPCPLCDGTDLFLRDIGGWELDCRGCELSLVLADDPSREGLVKRWNTRTRVHSTLAAENAALRPLYFRLVAMTENGPDCDCPAEGHMCGWPALQRELKAARVPLGESKFGETDKSPSQATHSATGDVNA